MKKELATFLLLVVLCAIVTALNPRFLSPANLQNTARLIGAFGIFSLGLGLVIITGGIDLSVGSAFALLGVLLSIMLTEWHLPWPAAVLIIIALGALLGAGPRSAHHAPAPAAVHRHAVRPAAVSRPRAVHRRRRDEGFGDAAGFQTLQRLATGSRRPACRRRSSRSSWSSAVMWVVLHRSVYGRHLFATGRNEIAARYRASTCTGSS